MHRMNPSKLYKATPKNGGIYRGKKMVRKPRSQLTAKSHLVPKIKAKNTEEKRTPELKEEKQWFAEAIAATVHATATKRRQHHTRTRHTTIAVLLNFMLLAASVASAARTLDKDASSASTISKMLRHVCTTKPFASPNKPGDVIFARYQLRDGQYASTITSCREHLLFGSAISERCRDELAEFKVSAVGLHSKIKQIRNEIDALGEKNLRETQVILGRMTYGLAPDLQEKIRETFNVMLMLKTIQATHKKVLKIKMGNCGEHADHAAMEIVKISDKYKTPIKLQRVKGYADDFTHGFLLIDTDLPDIEIRNDVKSVTAYLQSVTQGFVCDTWNEGYYEAASLNNEDNEIYRGGYHSINVKTISLDFDMRGFPKNVVEHIQDELQKLGLNLLSGKKPFHFFRPAPAKESATKTATQAPTSKHEL